MLKATEVKKQAKQLGADLVGICLTEILNANPPDPRWPQTPEKLWPDSRSVVVLAKRIPWGTFLAQGRTVRQYVPHLVMNQLDAVALELAYWLEEHGLHALPLPQQYTDTALKKGTYGPISLRHAAVEAGLGTLGLNLNLLTPEYGPRVYLTAVLVDEELQPDQRAREQLCLGPSCGRCLLACPADAVGYWSLDKRKCSRFAQQFGIAAIFNQLERLLSVSLAEERKNLLRSMEVVNFWQALRIGPGAYAGCLRCQEVCPVGEDYPVHLKTQQATIPEETEEKRQRLRSMQLREEAGEAASELEFSRRWVSASLD